MSLAEIATTPAVAEILSSTVAHTEAAKQICELGHPTTEASVRRCRARMDWTASRELAATSLAVSALPDAPDLAEQGYMLAEAMRTGELPDDPVTLLGYLLPYIGPGQSDLKAVRKTDSDGITTVTVTAVRDDFAEAAASLMATRITTGEGEHRCLTRVNAERVCVFWSPKSRMPLFPGASLTRYRRFGIALVRKLAAVGWELDGDRNYQLGFTLHHRAKIDEILGRALFDPEIDEHIRHKTAVHIEGL